MADEGAPDAVEKVPAPQSEHAPTAAAPETVENLPAEQDWHTEARLALVVAE